MKRSNLACRILVTLSVAAVLVGVCVGVAQASGHVVRSGSGTMAIDDTVFISGFGESPDVIRARQGMAIAPVSLDLDGRDVALVGLGSYLVNSIGGCNECHTNPPYAAGGNPFMGQPKQINVDHYLAGGNQFGPFVSRNITPIGADHLPAGFTYDIFQDVMRNGTDIQCAPGAPPPCPLLQVMPWPVLHHMSEHDLQAIYEYLRAIPYAEAGS